MQNQDKIGIRIMGKLLLLTDRGHASAEIAMLREEGYSVWHDDCREFDVGRLESLSPDAILIDFDRPSVSTVAICLTLRNSFAGPILILSAKTSEVVQLLALEMGADDFLFKPQPETILMAKLRAFLRRSEGLRLRQRKLIQLGELVIDAGRREVCCSGAVVSLTDREFDLLWCLAENSKIIVSRDEIHRSLYNSEYNGFDRSIDIYISRIRQKIGDDPLNPRYLKTVRGAGYLLVEGYLGQDNNDTKII